MVLEGISFFFKQLVEPEFVFKENGESMYVEYMILLMEEILHHLGGIKPCKSWDKLFIHWSRISSINSMYIYIHIKVY